MNMQDVMIVSLEDWQDLPNFKNPYKIYDQAFAGKVLVVDEETGQKYKPEWVKANGDVKGHWNMIVIPM